MSWDQEYNVPSYLELLVKLTGKHPEELLEAELMKQRIHVFNKEEIVLDDGMYDTIKGLRVTLSDGRVFVPKLVQQFTENGNHGIDSYEYVLEGETPNVVRIGLDSAEDDSWDETVILESIGHANEEPLESDGELEGELYNPSWEG